MSWSFSVLDNEAFDNNMATPISENAANSEVSITSPMAENVEHSEVSTTSSVPENTKHSQIFTRSSVTDNAEHSEASITSSVPENAKPSQVSTTSSMTDNVQSSEFLIASPDIEKPEQSLSLMTNPFSASLNSKVATTETESGHEEVASALPMDRLNIADEFEDNSLIAKTDNSEDVASAGTTSTIKEFANHTVIAAQDSEQDVVTSPAKSVSEAFLDFNRFPGEIRKKIVQHAMTAEEGKLEFTDRVGYFKPNVATGLLTTSRELYHDARVYLHSENNFIFRGCGAELRTILGQGHGLWSCKINGCKRASKGPKFNKVTIVLGDDVSMEVAGLKLRCTKAALEGLRAEVSIKMLHISFKEFCWVYADPEVLRQGLSRLNVGALGMFGAEFLWQENLRLFPEALGMDLCPVFVGTEPGFFDCGYKSASRAKQIEEAEEAV